MKGIILRISGVVNLIISKTKLIEIYINNQYSISRVIHDFIILSREVKVENIIF